MNNYDEIAKEVVKLYTGSYPTSEDLERDDSIAEFVYPIAYKAAQLQAERFNKDLDNSLIESLNKEDIC